MGLSFFPNAVPAPEFHRSVVSLACGHRNIVSHSDGHSVVKQRDAAPNHAFDKVCFLIKATLTAWSELSNFRCKDFFAHDKKPSHTRLFPQFQKGKLPRKVKEPHVT